MVLVLAANSFGASFGLPASGKTKCCGEAENRVLKRVGKKNKIHEKENVFNRMCFCQFFCFFATN